MSFKFIDNSNTLTTAGDADTLVDIDLEGIFKGQTKKDSFQLGNTGSSVTDFTCVVSGVNAGIRENVELSLDGDEWADTVNIYGVLPNRVTDLIYFRYTPDTDDYTADGTFLINVTES